MDPSEERANSRAECEAERRKIQRAFLDGTSVHATLQALFEMAERNIQEGLQAASHAHNLEPEGLAVLALGGFVSARLHARWTRASAWTERMWNSTFR